MSISDLVYVDANGIHYPDYETILSRKKDDYRTIYGSDVYLESDSQDGQLLAIEALAIYDTCQIAAAVYSSYSPSTAQSDALSRNVKINGIKRKVATYSQVDLRIVGQVGSVIANGIAEDQIGNKWLLPDSVTIPITGEITVTAMAENLGSISAPASTITKIATPTLGWQTVNNLASATEGVPVEPDADLRVRQTQSTAIPSLSVMDGIGGAIASIEGVVRSRGYENDSNVVDANGLPPHSISFVVDGGDVQVIGDTIAIKKTPGTGTYGTTSVTTYDKYGMPNVIDFFRPTSVTISVEITVDALLGYTTSIGEEIAKKVAAHINALKIGDDVLISRIYTPANLYGSPDGDTYDISLIRIKKNAGNFVTSNIVVAFNEAVFCNPATNVTVIAL
jgi:uncharacterized phage protein gp47/JayE